MRVRLIVISAYLISTLFICPSCQKDDSVAAFKELTEKVEMKSPIVFSMDETLSTKTDFTDYNQLLKQNGFRVKCIYFNPQIQTVLQLFQADAEWDASHYYFKNNPLQCWPETSWNYDFYAVYPSQYIYIDANHSPYIQVGSTSTGPTSDIVAAIAHGQTQTNGSVFFEFHHILSKLTVKLRSTALVNVTIYPDNESYLSETTYGEYHFPYKDYHNQMSMLPFWSNQTCTILYRIPALTLTPGEEVTLFTDRVCIPGPFAIYLHYNSGTERYKTIEGTLAENENATYIITFSGH